MSAIPRRLTMLIFIRSAGVETFRLSEQQEPGGITSCSTAGGNAFCGETVEQYGLVAPAVPHRRCIAKSNVT